MTIDSAFRLLKIVGIKEARYRKRIPQVRNVRKTIRC